MCVFRGKVCPGSQFLSCCPAPSDSLPRSFSSSVSWAADLVINPILSSDSWRVVYMSGVRSEDLHVKVRRGLWLTQAAHAVSTGSQTPDSWRLTPVLSHCPLSADDVLTKDAGECVICLEELLQGDTIARLPCLCIYHKRYEGAGRPSSATPRHQRAPSLWWEERAGRHKDPERGRGRGRRQGRLDARGAEPRRPVDP